MIVLIGGFEMEPGQAQSLVPAMEKLTEASCKDEGAVMYSWNIAADDENLVRLLEVWENEQTLRDHLELPQLTVETPLANLNVRHAGSGTPIVFLHNLFLSSEMWEEVAAALSGEYHVILIDGPGHGASSALAKPFLMSISGEPF